MDGTPLSPIILSESRFSRLLVIAPHPDDEIFGCGGLLAQQRLKARAATEDAPFAVLIIILTDGARGGNFQPHLSPAKTRYAESIHALQVLGIEDATTIETWGISDQTLTPNSEVFGRLAEAIKEFRPDVILAPSPLETHPDHQAASLSTFDAWSAAQHDKAHLSASKLLFYEVGQPLCANYLVNVTEAMDRKRRAMECFTSQLHEQNYATLIESLNRYRSYQVHDKATFVEAFVLIDTEHEPSHVVRHALARIAVLHEATYSQRSQSGYLSKSHVDQLSDINTKETFYQEHLADLSSAAFSCIRVEEDTGTNQHANEHVVVIVRTQWRSSLFRAIESVLTQSHRPISIVLVCAARQPDGFSDQLIRWSCKASLSQVDLIPCGVGYQPCPDHSLGRSQAINLGLERALDTMGQWLAFLDDDDQLMPDHFEALLAALRGHGRQTLKSISSAARPIVGAYSGTRILNEHSGLVDYLHEDWDRYRIIRANFLPIHAVVFSRAVAEVGIRADERFDLYEDWDFWISVSQLGDLIRAPHIGANYFQHAESLANNALYKDRQVRARQAIYLKWISQRSEAEVEAAFRIDELDIQRERSITRKVTEQLQIANDKLAVAKDQLNQLASIEREYLSHRAQHELVCSSLQALEFEVQHLHREITRRELSIIELRQSMSWRASAPLRWGATALRRSVSWCYRLARGLLKPLSARIGIPYPRVWLRQQFSYLQTIKNQHREISAINRDEIKALAQDELRQWLCGQGRIDFTICQAGPDSLRLEDSTPQTTKRVSVIVVLFNQAGLTKRCLDSIIAHARSDCFFIELELILVDNASTDETDALLSRIDGAKVIRNKENIGFLRAVNAASLHATGKYLLLLNNDAELLPSSLQAAIQRIESNPVIQAVGGPVILLDGSLQEAGNIIWKDASCLGYGRGHQPSADTFQHVRYVDYVSGAFLLTPLDRFLTMGRFNDQLAPAYYEESDYCVRLWQSGFRVAYEPLAAIRHMEFASSNSKAWAIGQQQKNQAQFLKLHDDWLRGQFEFDHPSLTNLTSTERDQAIARVVLRARARPPGVQVDWLPKDLRLRLEHPMTCPRVLVLDDRVPHPQLGSGFPRSNDILCTLAALGCHVCFYPVTVPVDDWAAIRTSLPATVEVVLHRGIQGLESFLLERSGWYSHLLISRPHNMAIFRPIWERYAKQFETVRIIYDAEAIFTYRDASLAKLRGEQANESQINSQLHQEMGLAIGVDCVTTVSNHEANTFKAVLPEILRLAQAHNLSNVRKSRALPQIRVLGHRLEAKPTSKGFEQRSGLLFVGALHEDNTPNAESLVWFIDEVWPLLKSQWSAHSSTEITFDIVGSCHAPSIWARRKPGIRLHGAVADLSPYFDQARVFVVPTRYAAGIPHKAHEAAARGVPMVVSRLIAQQLGWDDSLVCIADGSMEFASACINLLKDKQGWSTKRHASLARIGIDCSSRQFEQSMIEALGFSLEI